MRRIIPFRSLRGAAAGNRAGVTVHFLKYGNVKVQLMIRRDERTGIECGNLVRTEVHEGSFPAGLYFSVTNAGLRGLIH